MSLVNKSLRGRAAAILLVGLGVGVALPVAGAGSASAIGLCGDPKTARTSITYKACVEKIGSRNFVGHYMYSNNHGSAISITTQYGWKVDSRSLWDSDTITLRRAAGYVERETSEVDCSSGQRVTAIVRVKQNNGDWGPTASSYSYDC